MATTADPAGALRTSLDRELRTMRGPGVPLPPASLLDVAVEPVELPRGELLVPRPRDWGNLREDEALAKRPVPYWAIMWPSGIALARSLADEPLAGRRVLELGCGLGLPSAVAARRGAAVLATDGAPDAVVFAAHVLALNELEADVALVDWERDGEGLAASGPFDLILAADILYTRANVAAALRLLPTLLAPDGEILLADPGRTGAKEFLATARKLWRLRTTHDGDIALHRLSPRDRS